MSRHTSRPTAKEIGMDAELIDAKAAAMRLDTIDLADWQGQTELDIDMRNAKIVARALLAILNDPTQIAAVRELYELNETIRRALLSGPIHSDYQGWCKGLAERLYVRLDNLKTAKESQ